MCRLSEAELYCVSTKMRMTFEFMQFEIGTSTRRYLPPSGTAGFDRCRVSGNKRLPAPPPRITASKLCLSGMRNWGEDIGKEGEFQEKSITHTCGEQKLNRIHSSRHNHSNLSYSYPLYSQ